MTELLEGLTARERSDAAADRVRTLRDVRLPDLEYWNTSPCARHDVARPDCEFRECGGELWAHQRVGVSWLYARHRGLLADGTGTGKTNQIWALLALMKQRGELTGRALIVCQTPAARQWLSEGHRWVPRMNVEAALSGMTRRERVERYSRNWDALVIGSHMALRDVDMLERLAPGTLVVDDVDALLNHENATHRALNRLAATADRRVVINATTIQIKLQQLHAALTLTDGHDVFGDLAAFERRYVRSEKVSIWDARRGKKRTVTKTIGYKNMGEFKRLFAPMVLRRTDEMLTDVNMPTVMPPNDVWLEMTKPQRERYDELRKGVLRVLAEEGEQVKRVKALSMITYGQQICAGLPALRVTTTNAAGETEWTGRWEEDGPNKSPKLDWIERQLTTEWHDEKVVVFIKNRGTVAALKARMARHGVRTAEVVGGQDAAERQAQIDGFWNDDTCRIMVGTSAMERSLNLQVARHLIFVDLHLNPARVAQIVGRIKRGGSRHSHIYVHNLLMTDTQEEGYKHVLAARQALADFVFDDTSELFDQLAPHQLLELIGGHAS